MSCSPKGLDTAVATSRQQHAANVEAANEAREAYLKKARRCFATLHLSSCTNDRDHKLLKISRARAAWPWHLHLIPPADAHVQHIVVNLHSMDTAESTHVVWSLGFAIVDSL